MTNMEGIHALEGGAEADGDDRGVDVILVSDNNLVPEQPTQIVKLNIAGGLYAEDDASRGIELGAHLGGAAEGSNWRWSPTATAAAAAAVVVSKVAAAAAFSHFASEGETWKRTTMTNGGGSSAGISARARWIPPRERHLIVSQNHAVV